MIETELVQVKNWEIFTTSKIIAEKLEVPHLRILNTIEKIIQKNKDLGVAGKTPKFEEKFIETEFEHWKTKIKNKMILLNEPAFTRFIMNAWNYDKAYIIQTSFIQAFFHMKKVLQEHTNASWIEARQEWKIDRKAETDVIKKFVEYATEQWSTKAQFYYKHITNMTYKALELVNQEKPIRDLLNRIWLQYLAEVERQATYALEEWMEKELPYKYIYDLAKERVEKYCEFIPKKVELKLK